MMAVCGAIFDQDGYLLLTRRAASMLFFPKAWVLPGGGVEAKEHFETALLREIREETGISIHHSFLNKAGDNLTEGFTFNQRPCLVRPFYAFESCSYKDIAGAKLEPAKSTHLILFYAVKLAQKRQEIALRL